MYRIENPEYLYWIWLVAAYPALFALYTWWQGKAQKRWGDAVLLGKMSTGLSKFKPWLKTIYITLALAFLVIALANPQVGTRTETVKRQGVDLVFALDVSSSMLAEDIAPNRLEKAKYIIAKTLEKLGGDRVGIIAYAGKAYPVLPITTDYAAARMSLSSATPEFIPTPGTALDQAFDYSLKYFDPESPASKVLVVLSDGEDHRNDWKVLVNELLKRDIRVISIGLGTEQGGPIPMKQGSSVVGFKRDKDGEVVITRLDENSLREVANATGGAYVNGANTNQALEIISKTISTLNKTDFEERIFTDYDDQFQWFLAAALFFLCLETLTRSRKINWLR